MCAAIIHFLWLGYSPYECEFTSAGVKLVESSYSRVLSRWPRPHCKHLDDEPVLTLCEWILNMDISER